jgi:hypothetical protein
MQTGRRLKVRWGEERKDRMRRRRKQVDEEKMRCDRVTAEFSASAGQAPTIEQTVGALLFIGTTRFTHSCPAETTCICIDTHVCMFEHPSRANDKLDARVSSCGSATDQ